MKAFKIFMMALALIFGLSQVQFAQAGAWDKIKETSKKFGQSVKKDSKKVGETGKKVGKKTKEESKKGVKDAKKGLKEVADESP